MFDGDAGEATARGGDGRVGGTGLHGGDRPPRLKARGHRELARADGLT